MLIICLCDMHLCVNSLTVKTKYHIKATEDASSVLFEYSIAFKKTPMKSFFLSSSFSENVTIYCCKAHYRVNEYSVSSIFFFKIRRKRPLFRLLGKKHSRIFSCFQVINKSFIKLPQLLWCPFSFAFKRTIISTLCRQPNRSKAAKLSFKLIIAGHWLRLAYARRFRK